MQWLPIEKYTDEDIARWGTEFIKRNSSNREFVSNLNKGDYNKICTSLNQKLDELNPSVKDYMYKVKYYENIKKIMTSVLYR